MDIRVLLVNIFIDKANCYELTINSKFKAWGYNTPKQLADLAGIWS